MMKCFYCEVKDATEVRFGEPSCNDCHSTYFLNSLNELKGTVSDKDLAERYKVLVKTFGI